MHEQFMSIVLKSKTKTSLSERGKAEANCGQAVFLISILPVKFGKTESALKCVLFSFIFFGYLMECKWSERVHFDL